MKVEQILQLASWFGLNVKINYVKYRLRVVSMTSLTYIGTPRSTVHHGFTADPATAQLPACRFETWLPSVASTAGYDLLLFAVVLSLI